MTANRPGRPKKTPFKLNFARRKAAAELTVDEKTERDRLVEEYLQRKGPTRCPAGFSHMDW